MLPLTIQKQLDELCAHIASLPLAESVQLLNDVRVRLHEVSPFKTEPVDLVQWVPSQDVRANAYNPNSVAAPEFKLLEISIMEDGFTQPVVTWMDEGAREVVDGYHRSRICKESEVVNERVHSYLPVVTANEWRTDKGDRIASTIRHNRARGKHRIDSMSEIVLDLKRRNWSNEKIGRELGMDPDEILRLSQISGLAEMFADKEFSEAWEVRGIDTSDTLELTNENY
jgi:ParB-like chromosome segregation protein Spo0J